MISGKILRHHLIRYYTCYTLIDSNPEWTAGNAILSFLYAICKNIIPSPTYEYLGMTVDSSEEFSIPRARKFPPLSNLEVRKVDLFPSLQDRDNDNFYKSSKII